MKKTHLLTLIFSLASMQAAAEVVARDPSSGGARPDFKAARAACEGSQYNTGGITLPERPAPGQRPTLTDAQRSLIQACEQAGILPPHRHHHGPPPGEMAGGQPPGPPPADE